MTTINKTKTLHQTGGRMTILGFAGCAVAMVLMLAAVVITRSDVTPMPIAMFSVGILAVPLAGCAVMAEGSAREANITGGRMAARVLAVMLAAAALAMVVLAVSLI